MKSKNLKAGSGTYFRATFNPEAYANGDRSGCELIHNKMVVMFDGTIQQIDNVLELGKFPETADVIGVWPGEQSSDFVYFKVGDLLHFIRQNS